MHGPQLTRNANKQEMLLILSDNQCVVGSNAFDENDTKAVPFQEHFISIVKEGYTYYHEQTRITN